jgi:hypothetical protein
MRLTNYPSHLDPKNPKIIFCSTCKGRVQHIEKTLPQNIADNADYLNVKFVLVDYSSPDHLNEYLQREHHEELQSGKLVVYSFPNAGPFNMAHAKNMAHRLGVVEGGDILVNLDADNYTGKGFASYIAEQFRGETGLREDLFLWAHMVKDGPNKLPRGINGRIAVTKRAFINSGGYDEKYTTWAPDDKDFHLRLRRMGYVSKEIDPYFLNAVLHNDKMRFKEYKHIANEPMENYDFEVEIAKNFKTVTESDGTIANFGKIGQGTVIRNFGSYPMVLGPIPTRIFGIGMHKTGTTSLHTALRILGYESAHWKSASWAKAIWREMTMKGRSVVLERSYALCDLPIPILYQKLDRAYPGSKFILTTRNETRWLSSVKNHWDCNRNSYRMSWDTDSFTHRIHEQVYGTREFDAGIFLERFRRHNSDVREYFKNRPEDLLVMDMDKNAGWLELCHFLECSIPSVAYPLAFPTKRSI